MSQETQQHTSTRKAHGMVFAGAFCISFAALFVQGAAMDPSMVAFYRLLSGGIALLAFALVRRDRVVPSAAMVKVLVPAGLFFALDLIVWHEGIVRIGPGLATITTNFQVFILALHGSIFLGEKLSFRHKVAMPLAIVGLFMILEVNPTKLPDHMAEGIALCLAAAFLYSGYILTLRKSLMLREHLSPVANMATISLMAAVAIAAFCVSRGISFEIPDLQTGLYVAALGIFCQGVGWVLLSLGLPYLPPSRAGLIMLAQPALSFLWDIVFCGRVTGPIGYLGATTAIFAIWLGVGGPAKNK